MFNTARILGNIPKFTQLALDYFEGDINAGDADDAVKHRLRAMLVKMNQTRNLNHYNTWRRRGDAAYFHYHRDSHNPTKFGPKMGQSRLRPRLKLVLRLLFDPLHQAFMDFQLGILRRVCFA